MIQKENNRINIIAVAFVAIAAAIIARLFYLQILQHDYYSAFALSTHEIYKQIHPRRGEIFFQDTRANMEYPAAVNRDYFTVYAAPVEIPPETAPSTTEKLAQFFPWTDIEKQKITKSLGIPNDPYEPIAKKVDDATVEKIKNENLTGIHFAAQEYRYYPEKNISSSVLGFSRLDDSGLEQVGNYGVEGFWNKTLAGRKGFILGEKGASGNLITFSDSTKKNAEDGADIILTIERTIQHNACSSLKSGMEQYKAAGGSLVMMNPKTGAIIAMCSVPDYDPNKYSEVADAKIFSNSSISEAYEPGSVYKPFTMVAGIDLGLISPNTTFTDPCKREINGFTLRNAEEKCYGNQTMTQVLENSINTGVIFVAEKVGKDNFQKYSQNLGFGEKTGIELSNEARGDVSSLDKNGLIYIATASYGQGITATPIQLASAYSAIANNGKLMKPFVVSEIRYGNGKKESFEPAIQGTAMSERTSKLVSGMLTSVVEKHYTSAKIPGYYVAGKTGTAQIAEKGKYVESKTNHTFAGFAPATSPEIVLVVKYENPQRAWAESTTLPVFREVMDFALNYYGIKKDKKI
jgi:cell division protein FtsI/penicillin-binding protein 2